MAGEVKPIPEGFRSLTPHLIIKGASEAIEFYKSAFGAEECYRMPGPDGNSIMHASIRIGDSILMLNDEFPEHCIVSPKSLNGSPVTVHLYVENVDEVFEQAVKAGAKATMPVTDTFWGDRYGKLEDPFGHQWSIATRKEELSPEDIRKRAAEHFMGGQKK